MRFLGWRMEVQFSLSFSHPGPFWRFSLWKWKVYGNWDRRAEDHRNHRRICGVHCRFYKHAPPQTSGAFLGTSSRYSWGVVCSPLLVPSFKPPPPSGPLLQPLLTSKLKRTDLDNSPASLMLNRRIHPREIHPLARGRLLCEHCRNSALPPPRRLCCVHHRRLQRKNPFLHFHPRRHGGIQLPHPRLG